MSRILSSYLRYARGESGGMFPWVVLNFFGATLRPFVRLRNAMYDR